MHAVKLILKKTFSSFLGVRQSLSHPSCYDNIMNNNNMIENNKTKRVTRVEIIDETGRAIVMTNLASVKLSLQDDERTLKLFVTHKSPTHAS